MTCDAASESKLLDSDSKILPFPPLGARHDEEHQSRNISVCFFVVDLLTTEKENKPVFISGKPCETLRKSNTAMA